jgi:hypothetical protein
MTHLELKQLQLSLAKCAQHNLLANAGINITGLQAADLAAHLVMCVQNFARKYTSDKKEQTDAK